MHCHKCQQHVLQADKDLPISDVWQVIVMSKLAWQPHGAAWQAQGTNKNANMFCFARLLLLIGIS